MRWRFADRIDAFEPWKLIRGRKGISLEEYSLMERFGRPGVMPESLVLESCVHFARWLVAASSQWQLTCLLWEIEEFVYEAEARMGGNLRVELTSGGRADHFIRLECAVCADERPIARGSILMEITPLMDFQDPESLKIMWRELHGAA